MQAPPPQPVVLEGARARPSHRFYVVSSAETETEHLTDANNGPESASPLADAPLPRAQVERLLRRVLQGVPEGAQLDTTALRGPNPLGYLLSLHQDDATGAPAYPNQSAAQLQAAEWPRWWADRADAAFVRHRNFDRDANARLNGGGQYRWQVKRARLLPTRKGNKDLPVAALTRRQAILRLAELWRMVCNLPQELREMLIPMTRSAPWGVMPDEMPAFTAGGLRYLKTAPGEADDGTPWADGYARLPPAFFGRTVLWDPRWRLAEAGHAAPDPNAGIDAHTVYFSFQFRPDLVDPIDQLPPPAAAAAVGAAAGAGAQPQEEQAVQEQEEQEALSPQEIEAALALHQLVPGGLEGGARPRRARGGRRVSSASAVAGAPTPQDAWTFRQEVVGESGATLTGSMLPTETRVSRFVRGEGTDAPLGRWLRRAEVDGGARVWDVSVDGAWVEVHRQAATLRLLKRGRALYRHVQQRVAESAVPSTHPLRRHLAAWSTPLVLCQALQGVFLARGLVVVSLQDVVRHVSSATRAAWAHQLTRSCQTEEDDNARVGGAGSGGSDGRRSTRRRRGSGGSGGDEQVHNRAMTDTEAELLMDADSWMYQRGEYRAGTRGAFDSTYAVLDWHASKPALRGVVVCRNGADVPLLRAFDLAPTPRPDAATRTQTLTAMPYVSVSAAVRARMTPAALRANLHVHHLCGADASLLLLYALAARSRRPYKGVSVEVPWGTAATEDDGAPTWPVDAATGAPVRAVLPDPRLLSVYHDLFGFQRTFHLGAGTAADVARHTVFGDAARVASLLSVFRLDGAEHPPYERVFTGGSGTAYLAASGRLLVEDDGGSGSGAAALATNDHQSRDKALRSYYLYRPYPLPGVLFKMAAHMAEHDEALDAIDEGDHPLLQGVDWDADHLVGGSEDEEDEEAPLVEIDEDDDVEEHLSGGGGDDAADDAVDDAADEQGTVALMFVPPGTADGAAGADVEAAAQEHDGAASTAHGSSDGSTGPQLTELEHAAAADGEIHAHAQTLLEGGGKSTASDAALITWAVENPPLTAAQQAVLEQLLSEGGSTVVAQEEQRGAEYVWTQVAHAAVDPLVARVEAEGLARAVIVSPVDGVDQDDDDEMVGGADEDADVDVEFVD